MTEHTAGLGALPIAGFSVSQCIVDFAFSLRFVKSGMSAPDGDAALLRIEAPFELADGTATYRCDVERDPTAAGPALALFNRRVVSAEVDTERVLRLTFENRSTISVPSDMNYEAWTLVGPHGLLVVCMPGGELAVFPPLEPTGD